MSEVHFTLRISTNLDQSCLVTALVTKQTVHDVLGQMNQSLTVVHYVICVMQGTDGEKAADYKR